MTRILIADDSPIDRRLAGRLLMKDSDWTIVDSVDGRDALAKLEQGPLPDLVVTDLTMPEMDGLQLVEEIKERYPTIPVILMTSMGSEETAVRALRQGAAGYVPKRRLAEDLHATVNRLLASCRQQQTHAELLNRLARFECAFSIENDQAMVLSLPAYLQNVLKSMKLMDENEHLRLSVAIEEALTNALYHGNLEISSEMLLKDHQSYFELAKRRAHELPYRERRIYFSARITPTEAVYVVRDQGPGFDPSLIPDPTEPGNMERPYGRGILLMRSFMDEVTYNPKGNEVTLVKRRSIGNIDDLDIAVV